jgi:hypothetical protein
MDENLADGLVRDMGMRVPSKLVDFGRALDSACVLSDGWAYFLEKPAEWSREYARWSECGYPQAGEPGWSDFMNALDSVAT